MSTENTQEANKAIARRLYEDVITDGNLAALEDIVAADVYDHSLVPQGLPPTRETFTRHITGFRAAFPDIQVTVDEMVAEGDRVVVVWSATGTHRGPFGGVAPTGRRVSGTNASILRLRDGRITEYRVFRDRLETLQQLGATITLPTAAPT